MCRSIKTLREGTALATPEEVEAAALQFVRKVSGFRSPAAHNREAFETGFARNFWPALDASRAALPALEASRGAVINVASIWGRNYD